ncbi:peptidase U32 family protein [Marinifilum caeruleilacunae]|uniref:U32 family peptidase n=1 Tax=Marinifilum caeruleilacunae TaxID=2499076 RepID=A0ABX1WSV4_9BACT|nr:U32 family peptidase [Marinifilum caeruleilacunae]NOU59185.1 U32 family peptidase [Marinifilum caeruleilacunae]
MKKIELLAPAKNLETGIAAINYGADAVYIGAPKFGARSAAGNTLEDIGKLIEYAHQYWAKVFITMNTILYDHELKEAEQLIHKLYDLGADALIVQDMGILEMDLPPIELHASTQTHNYDLDRIQFLEKVGFKRIILARELSLEEIKNIRKHTNVELEYFVHGALCVSLSGQCYFSHAIGGRSANRGECSQACRMRYDLVDEEGKVIAKDKHLLSLKDLNLSDHLEEIVDAGICSLKIEGRLKDSSYLKNVTNYYRKSLDRIFYKKREFEAASSGSVKPGFKADPEITFNRGYTSYFFTGRIPEIANFYTPKSMGKEIGKIREVKKDHIVVDSKFKLHNGDGLCFFNKNKLLKGFQVNGVQGNKVFPNDMSMLQKGVALFRNNDHEFAKLLKKDKSIRKIGVEFFLDIFDGGLNLTAIDEDEMSASIQINEHFEAAKNEELAFNNIQKQLQKSGDSIYEINQVDINTEQVPFIQAKVLNDLRRQCLEQLTQTRIETSKVEESRPLIAHPPYPAKQLSYMGNVVNCKAEEFYHKCGVEKIEKGFELQKNHSGKAIMTTKHCLRHEFGMCHKETKTGKKQNQALFLVDNRNRYRLEFNCQRCEMKIIFG